MPLLLCICALQFQVSDGRTREVLFKVLAGEFFDCFDPSQGPLLPGAGSTIITKSPTVETLAVAVNAPCGGTAWEYTMSCATNKRLALPAPPSGPNREKQKPQA